MLPGLFGFQAGDTVASIGCGGGVWEIGWMFGIPELTCYLVDIDPDLLNDNEVNAAIDYWQRQQGAAPAGRFLPVIGTGTTIPLADASADKVLILNALHEFDFPDEMLAEVRRILRSGGRLFVEEEEARFPGELHDGCGRPLYTIPELQQQVTRSGFAAGPVAAPADRARILTFYR